jgi:hypothetical protein
MHFSSQKTSILLTGILLTCLLVPLSTAANYDRSYTSAIQFGLDEHEIYVSIPPSLYDYYHGKSHVITSEAQYSTFVTPGAVASIARNIRNMTSREIYGDEEFVNAVLRFVQQIPYVEGEAKFPVETLVENEGDCDTVSLLAASILEAENLDVVLFYYKNAAHMNIGVHLSNKPSSSWWAPPTSYEYNGVEYWMAECTPKAQWRVGDQPASLGGEKPVIIPIDEYEKSPPAQAASEIDEPLNSSSISINLSSPQLTSPSKEFNMTVTGSISPTESGANVAMYLSKDRTSWDFCKTVTDDAGKYSFEWNFTSTGTYYIRTSFSGISGCAGADSEILTVFIGFPKNTVQFRAPDYIYILGNPGAATYELRVRQGVQEFLNLNLLGTGIEISGEFIVVKSGETALIEENPEIPLGEQPLRLPINFVRNDQFCFLMENYGRGNYKVHVKAMDDYAVSEIQEFQGNKTVLLNGTSTVRDNTWYKVTAKMSESEITAALFDTEGVLLKNMAITKEAASIGEIGILLANSTDKAIAFRNLKIETVNQPLPPLDEGVTPANNTDVFTLYINWIIVLTSISTGTFYIWKKERKQELVPENRM